MNWFLSAPLQPFSIAAAVLLGLIAIEMIGLLIGSSPSEALGSDGHEAFFERALGWMNLGKVPALVLLIILLALFAVGGMMMQAMLALVTGPLPALPASGVAAVLALLTIAPVSRAIARIMPRDESYALADDDLIGRVGTVSVGPLNTSFVGKISVVDGHGNRHFPRARPTETGETIEIGAEVLIVATAGREYRVVRAPAQLVGEHRKT